MNFVTLHQYLLFLSRPPLPVADNAKLVHMRRGNFDSQIVFVPDVNWLTNVANEFSLLI